MVTEVQAMLLDGSHFAVRVTVLAVVTNPPCVEPIVKVYCPLPAVPEHEVPVSVPEGVVTVRARQTVVVPTPVSGTSQLSVPAAILVKDLGDSPVYVKVVAPIVAVVCAPVTPTPVSTMPPPVALPVLVPEREMSTNANAGAATKAERVSMPIIASANFVMLCIFLTPMSRY
jgi:hypothetical protein